jgi:hypothetical protein
MVAYSFKARFVEPIQSGLKAQTIRAERKRHARPGEALQLYTAMRTKQCTLVGTATCARIDPIRLDFDCGRIEFPATGLALTMLPELDAFARIDGFDDWRGMMAFWAREHPGDQFSGVIIHWTNFEVSND